MIYVVIVGSEEKYWTERQKRIAKTKIGNLIYWFDYMYEDGVRYVSGHCPKGGVDIWVEEILAGAKTSDGDDKLIIYKPRGEEWKYYKARNLEMANIATHLYDIEPEWESWMGIRRKVAYEGLLKPEQIGKFFRRSGGYWTLERAKERGVETEVIIIERDP